MPQLIPISAQQAQSIQAGQSITNAGLQQPATSLQSTQTSIIGGQQANTITARQVAQNQAVTDTSNLFQSYQAKGEVVPPDVYNTQKSKLVGLGMTSDAFDGQFEHNFTDPRSIQYNTATGFANKNAYGMIKDQIQAQIDKYNAIPTDEKGIYGKTNIVNQGLINTLINAPGELGDKIRAIKEGKDNYLKQNAPEAYAYDQATQGFAAQFKPLVTSAGGGLRVTQAELDNWQNLLPAPGDSPSVAQAKIQELDKTLQATFKSPSGLDPKYLQSSSNGNGKDLLNKMINRASSGSRTPLNQLGGKYGL